MLARRREVQAEMFDEGKSLDRQTETSPASRHTPEGRNDDRTHLHFPPSPVDSSSWSFITSQCLSAQCSLTKEE